MQTLGRLSMPTALDVSANIMFSHIIAKLWPPHKFFGTPLMHSSLKISFVLLFLMAFVMINFLIPISVFFRVKWNTK